METPSNDGVLVYTLRQLHEDTAEVIKEMHAQNKPAVITRMGRFIALIHPLANIENLEGKSLMTLVSEIGDESPAFGPLCSSEPQSMDVQPSRTSPKSPFIPY